MSNFGQRLSQLFAGKKQKEIAKQLGVTDAAVRNYLGGRMPDLDKLQLIATATGCNLHWLLTGEGNIYQTETKQSVLSDITIDELIDKKIRSLLKLELASKSFELIELGEVDEFNLEKAVELYDNPSTVLTAWYRHDGLPPPELTAFDFSGWADMDLATKAQQIRAARGIMDRQQERRKNAPTPTDDTV